MGGAVSAGKNNDELIDHLVSANVIRSKKIEEVFRAVDRGHYFLDQFKRDAYRDTAWKDGDLHLSAPCIYSEVMEYLDLKPGLSFLHLGSGTGYLSTMVGIILGSTGINHGIELHQSVVEYACKKLEEFVSDSKALKKLDFCEPVFIVGNCLKIDSSTTRLYDRIYCGTACSDADVDYIKKFLKIDGLIVVPIDQALFLIKRTSETEFLPRSISPVSFASIIQPNLCDPFVALPTVDPPRLKNLCREKIKGLINLDVLQSVEWRNSPERRILTFYNIVEDS